VGGCVTTVSVLIPTYNCAAYLPAALDSVLAQTRPADEVLVIDDGSTDATAEVLAPYRDRIVCVRQANAGQAAARNAGLDRAAGDWVAFLDADDTWAPDKLERQLALASSGEYVCVHSGYHVFGAAAYVPTPPDAVRRGLYDLASLFTGFLILPSTALVRGGLPARFPTWSRMSEDTLYFAEVSRLGRIGYVDAPLAGYRKHPGSVTQRPGSSVQSFESRFRWIDRAELEPAAREELRRTVFAHLAETATLARWGRDWPRYWALRRYLSETWPYPEPPPTVAREWVYPGFVYQLRDAVGRLLAGVGGGLRLGWKGR
jgi:glycosyltransferase involved in cell wall biosynthesis